MRYVVVGAGAIGGAIGARLVEAGRPVVLVARGRHADAMRRDGLRFATPDGESALPVDVVTAPGEVSLRPDDVLVLSVKSQDTAATLADWSSAPVEGGGTAGERLPLVCAQNGVDNERTALRYFASVYGMCVWLPAELVEPGVIVAGGSPHTGVLTVGRYPQGDDETIAAVAADLAGARFVAPVVPDVMRWKHLKLLTNLGNAVDALVPEDDEQADPLAARARAEGEAVLDAAGIAYVGPDEEAPMRRRLVMHDVPGRPRGGGSTWQSLQRGTGSVETDYLNGEIVRIARNIGHPAPVNAVLQRAAAAAARSGERPRTRSAAELLAEAVRFTP